MNEYAFHVTVYSVYQMQWSVSFSKVHIPPASFPPSLLLLGPLDTAATNRPIVPAPADYDDGEIGGMIGKGNRSTRRKPVAVPLCPPQTPHASRTRTQAAAVGSQ
jgi:hypothetical protein